MKYLLDTNVISETVRKKPHPSVTEFFDQIDPATLFLSALTIGEIRKGIEQLQHDLHKKQKLVFWLENDLINFFAARILPIDEIVADKWGFLLGNINTPMAAIDSLIAATAISHNLILVTRNTADFVKFPLEIFNPWEN